MKLRTFLVGFIVSIMIVPLCFGAASGSIVDSNNSYISENEIVSLNGDSSTSVFGVNEVKYVNDISKLLQNKIILVECVPQSKQQTSYYTDLKSAIMNGNPIITLSGSSILLKENLGMSTAFSTEAISYGYHYDAIRDITTCYSIESENEDYATSHIVMWADEIIKEMNNSIQISSSINGSKDSPSWGSEIRAWGERQCTDYGTYYSRTCYFEENTSSVTNRYFLADYNLQSVPNSNGRTAEMDILCDVDYYKSTNMLLDYDPTTTSGTSTASVSLGWSVDTSGGGINMSTGWSYTISDVSVNDNSNYGNNILHIRHDVDELKSVGANTYYVKPGYVASSTKSVDNGEFRVQDTYHVQYCHLDKGFWPWSPWYGCDYEFFLLTVDVNIV